MGSSRIVLGGIQMKNEKSLPMLKAILIVIGFTLFSLCVDRIIVSNSLYWFIIPQDSWDSLCMGIWSGQLVVAFFWIALLQFVFNSNSQHMYGIKRNVIMSNIYKLLGISIVDAIWIAVGLICSNLIFLLSSSLNGVILLFLLNAFIVAISLLISVNCMIEHESVKTQLKIYIVQKYVCSKSSLGTYVGDLSKNIEKAFASNDDERYDLLDFFYNEICLPISQDKNVINFHDVIMAITTLMPNLSLYLSDEELVEKLDLSGKLFNNIYNKSDDAHEKIHKSTAKILTGVLFAQKVFDNEIGKHIVEKWESLFKLWFVADFETASNIFDNLCSNLFEVEQATSANALLSVLWSQFDDCVENSAPKAIIHTNWLNGLILYLKKSTDSHEAYLSWTNIINSTNRILKHNMSLSSENLQHWRKDDLKNICVQQVIRVYNALYLNPNLQNFLSSFEHDVVSYAIDKTDLAHDISESLLLYIIKRHSENKDVRLLSILDEIIHYSPYGDKKVQQKEGILARLAFYFYYYSACTDTFTDEHRSFIREALSKKKFPSHASFLEVMASGQINIWLAYRADDYRYPVFSISMEYTSDKINYVFYSPYTDNQWIQFFTAYSLYVMKAHKLRFDWSSLSYGHLLNLFETICQPIEKLDADKKALIDLGWAKIEIDNYKLLYRFIHNEFKRISLKENEENNATVVKDKLVEKFINDIRTLLNINNEISLQGCIKEIGYTIESKGVLSGKVSGSDNPAEDTFVRIKKLSVITSDIFVDVGAIKISDEGLCHIERKDNLYKVNITNNLYVDMTEEELIDYLNKHFVKVVIYRVMTLNNEELVE